jgi:tetratricopeptide (TPR) repeat protein
MRTLIAGAWGVLAFVALICECAHADTVKLRDKAAFRNVSVVGFEDGRLEFRGVSRQILRKPIESVEWFTIDAVPAVEAAERPVEGAPTSVEAYQLAIEQAKTDWLRKLLRIRMVAAMDRTGQFDDAVAQYLKLLADRVDTSQLARPRRPLPAGDPANQRALNLVESALEYGRYRAFATELRTLQLEVLLCDEAPDLPEPFKSGPVSTATSEPTAGAPAPMFGDVPIKMKQAPTLRADSPVFNAVASHLDAGRFDRAAAMLQRARPFAASEAVDLWRIQNARCEIAQGQPAKAAATLVKIAESKHGSSALAAEALYYVGFAHEGMARADVARSVYGELLARDDLPKQVRELAQTGMDRVRR